MNDFFDRKPDQNEPPPSDRKSPPKQNTGFFLEISEPANQAVIPATSVSVEGYTSPNALITITTNDESSLTLSDTEGRYRSEAELSGGVNQIEVTGFDNSGKSLSKSLLLVHSTYLKNGEHGISLIGTVTDLSESTIQIKTLSGEIEQISVNKDETTYANIMKSSREIEFTDLALGDFIVAIGKSNGNDIIEAQRILVTTALSESTIRAVWGEVKTYNTKEFIIKDIGGNDWSIDAKGGVEVTKLVEDEFKKAKLTSLKEGDTIIVIGEFDKEEIDANQIHLVTNN
ncbi:MAG: hypothetical protein UV74_C0013G0116 [Candidatus Woesebacteria bacterium GW2011_GWB1_43_14]|uniref:DUF5666 domain-containing protein n=1 Tax=Candidatus Woesebacteria bacterium GW2011_GWB1_43_14 TaxID=1618578 RepID=A0A0G1DH15_9BACT|nr:MAG: hypothetical protein UV51_C0005G0108 [Candidatus Woesebacteria bacterium GW2011_GWC1_42_9]KKS96994.1 MAG: hypothetical protein UV74_C0013G0116 [Candidatus Woesebacteria bacterium GW2011_GWB1_43_14]